MDNMWTAEAFLRCSGSKRFAKEMAAAAPFPDLDAAVRSARDIWFNKVDVNGWLEGFAAHPAIGATSPSISQWSKEEQSAAAATASIDTSQELAKWNALYREKFGFVFMICASGRGSSEILAELKKRYLNRPIVELELAAQEEMKIIELRLARLFESTTVSNSPATTKLPLVGPSGGSSHRSRPPIMTHVLDTARGCPAPGVEVRLEMWKGTRECVSFTSTESANWALVGASETNSDGRSGPLMDIVDHITPGYYRISFNTGKYVPSGFFPYVSIVFEVKENQTSEHFHVPLLHSPFSFATYRGS